MHIRGHQKGLNIEARGNKLADLAAKDAALEGKETKVMKLNLGGEETLIPPIFKEQEKQRLIALGGKEDSQGQWYLPDGHQRLHKELTREVLLNIHQTNHWGSRALVDHFLRIFGCPGVYELANQITRDCLICQTVN